MKAQNLTISVPNRGCDKNCPYCISKMTGYTTSDWTLMVKNYPKVIKLAEAANVTNVLLTGKAEPCLNMGELEALLIWFKDFPLELQTNGLWLKNNLTSLQSMAGYGLNVLAISVDSLDQMYQFREVVKHCHYNGVVARVTLNVTQMLKAYMVKLETMIYGAREMGFDQLTIRKIVAPRKIVDTQESADAAKWIKSYADPKHFDSLMNQLSELAPDAPIREILFDHERISVYDFDGIAVTGFEYCIQEYSNSEEIRSLIFDEDGHVYTAWNSKASILF